MVVNIFGLGEIQPALQKQLDVLQNKIHNSAPMKLKDSISKLNNEMVHLDKKYNDTLNNHKIAQENSIDLLREELNERMEYLENELNEINEILTAYRNDLGSFKRKVRGRNIERQRITQQQIETMKERVIIIANENIETKFNQLKERIDKIDEKLN